MQKTSDMMELHVHVFVIYTSQRKWGESRETGYAWICMLHKGTKVVIPIHVFEPSIRLMTMRILLEGITAADNHRVNIFCRRRPWCGAFLTGEHKNGTHKYASYGAKDIYYSLRIITIVCFKMGKVIDESSFTNEYPFYTAYLEHYSIQTGIITTPTEGCVLYKKI